MEFLDKEEEGEILHLKLSVGKNLEKSGLAAESSIAALKVLGRIKLLPEVVNKILAKHRSSKAKQEVDKA